VREGKGKARRTRSEGKKNEGTTEITKKIVMGSREDMEGVNEEEE
jgi:hypothetical protein